MIQLCIVGSVAIDSVETPFGNAENVLGGSASYASVAASYFARPGIVGVVGDDFPKQHISLLKKRGIDLRGLQVDPQGKTFFWSGYYEGDMNVAVSRTTCLNVFERFSPIIPESYRNARCLMLGNIHPSLQLEVLAQMIDPHLVLCDTMNFWIESALPELEKVLSKVDVICVNDGEAALLTGELSVPRAAQKLLKYGPSRVIIKKGGHGVAMFGQDTFFSLPAMPLAKVKDPTGAGDTFAGGFMGAVAGARTINENAFRKGIIAGTVLASFNVEDFSLRMTSKLAPDQINERIAQLREYTRLPRFIVKSN